MTKNLLIWLGDWYQSNCNGDWEHEYGTAIETIDNPGWAITIDVSETIFNAKQMPWFFVENNTNDWYGFKFLDGNALNTKSSCIALLNCRIITLAAF